MRKFRADGGFSSSLRFPRKTMERSKTSPWRRTAATVKQAAQRLGKRYGDARASAERHTTDAIEITVEDAEFSGARRIKKDHHGSLFFQLIHDNVEGVSGFVQLTEPAAVSADTSTGACALLHS